VNRRPIYYNLSAPARHTKEGSSHLPVIDSDDTRWPMLLPLLTTRMGARMPATVGAFPRVLEDEVVTPNPPGPVGSCVSSSEVWSRRGSRSEPVLARLRLRSAPGDETDVYSGAAAGIGGGCLLDSVGRCQSRKA
jgi:hypothetical protein